MKSTERILHEKQYAGRILEITQDTLFFIHKDGICLDFKPNTPDFYIKEEEVMHKDIFSFFPADTAGEMREECRKVLAHGQPSAKNYMLAKDKEVKYFKCIINRFDDEHLILQYRDITGRSVVRMNLEKNRKELREVEKAANIGLWSFDSGTRLFTYSGYTGVLCYGEEVKTASLEEYVSYIHPQDRKAFGEWVEDLVEGRKGRGFLEYRMTPGQQVNNMRVLAYNIEAYDGRTIVEGYIQNLTDIVQEGRTGTDHLGHQPRVRGHLRRDQGRQAVLRGLQLQAAPRGRRPKRTYAGRAHSTSP